MYMCIISNSRKLYIYIYIYVCIYKKKKILSIKHLACVCLLEFSTLSVVEDR